MSTLLNRGTENVPAWVGEQRCVWDAGKVEETCSKGKGQDNKAKIVVKDQKNSVFSGKVGTS